MRAPLSVIVPTLNAAGELPGLLQALIEGVEAGLIRELVISDGGSDDATRAVAQAAGAIWVQGPPGRGGQLGRGARAAAGDWLMFVHADSWPEPGWAEAVATHMLTCPDRAAAFRLAFRAQGVGARRTAAWGNFRSRALGLPYGDQGLVLSRRLYDHVGGYPDQPLMEDVAIVRRLGRRRLALLPVTITTDAERYLRAGWTRHGAANLWRLVRFLAGTDPRKLARTYTRNR